jgi:AbrB family looped-hinge helix DNA binding protein
MVSTVTERGQISIPAQIRKKLHLKPGMGIMWIERDEGIFLMPIPEDPIKAFQDTSSPMSTEDLLKARRADRMKEKK